eukprot:305622_1
MSIMSIHQQFKMNLFSILWRLILIIELNECQKIRFEVLIANSDQLFSLIEKRINLKTQQIYFTLNNHIIEASEPVSLSVETAGFDIFTTHSILQITFSSVKITLQKPSAVMISKCPFTLNGSIRASNIKLTLSMNNDFLQINDGLSIDDGGFHAQESQGWNLMCMAMNAILKSAKYIFTVLFSEYWRYKEMTQRIKSELTKPIFDMGGLFVQSNFNFRHGIMQIDMSHGEIHSNPDNYYMYST